MPGAAAGKATDPKKEWPGLAASLAALDDAVLARLLARRPDLASPPPRDFPSLASRAGGWASARDAFYNLDRAAQHVVEALCLFDQPPSVAGLASLLAVAPDDADLASAVDRLRDLALVFVSGGSNPTVRLLPALRQLEYPARLGPPLPSTNPPVTAMTHSQVAARLGVEPGRTNAATLAAIRDVLTDPAQVERLLREGPPGTAELARRVATEGPLVGVESGVFRVDDRTPAGWLLNRRFLVIVDYFSALMPREPAIAIRGGRAFADGCLRRPSLSTSPVDVADVDGAAAEQALQAVADVTTLLDLWGAEPAAILKAGGLGVREVHRLAKVIGRDDVDAARIIELAAVAGLVGRDYVAGLALPTVASDAWLAQETPARWAALARAWLAADLHLSVAGAIGPKDKPIAPLLSRSPERHAARRRQIVLRVLDAVPPGRAVEPTQVRDQVEWDSPATWGGGPASAPMLIGWVLHEAVVLGMAARGAMSSAGRAAFAGATDDAAAALARFAPPAVDDFLVQADLTAVVAGEPTVAVRSELDLLADLESKGAASVYRFSEASLRRGFDAGRTADDVLGFLERHARRGVPQPLTYLVTDLGRRFGNVRVGTATTYLRSDEPSLLAEIAGARRLARLRLRRLAPTVLVTDVDGATVTTGLQAAGYLPAREGVDGALVLSRPPARRLPERRVPARYTPAPPDVAALVDELRRAPAAATSVPAPPRRHIGLPQPTPLPAIRPIGIAKDPASIRGLLSDASDELWLVRLAYVNSQGHSTEITVEPTDVDDRRLYAHCFPRRNERSFMLDLIEWARVLTEAEEDLV